MLTTFLARANDSRIPFVCKNLLSFCCARVLLFPAFHFGHISCSTARAVWCGRCFFRLFFLHPIYYLRPSCPALSLLVVTQIRGHTVGSSPPSPVGYNNRLDFLSRERFRTFFPRRLLSNCDGHLLRGFAVVDGKRTGIAWNRAVRPIKKRAMIALVLV